MHFFIAYLFIYFFFFILFYGFIFGGFLSQLKDIKTTLMQNKMQGLQLINMDSLLLLLSGNIVTSRSKIVRNTIQDLLDLTV